MSQTLPARLAAAELADFRRCEAVVSAGLFGFVKVGEALAEIRDRRLYRETHVSFEQYIEERWGISPRRGRQLMVAAETVRDLNNGTTVPKVCPDTERQARALSAVRPDLRQLAWETAVERSEGEPTAADVSEAGAYVTACAHAAERNGAPATLAERRFHGESARPSIMASGHSDEFATLPAALDPLLPYIPKEWTIWEAAPGQKGLLAAALAKRQARVIAEDRDFLLWRPGEHWDCIITNPPYGIKDEFLERAYGLGMPFALLMRDAVFDSRDRRRLFRAHGVQIILPDGRCEFVCPSGKIGGSWFYCVWVTWGLNLPREINHGPLKKGAAD